MIYITLLFPLLSAALMALSFPVTDGYYLAFIALVPLFYVFEKQNFWMSLLALQIFVVVFYTFLLWWVRVFHPYALPGLVLYVGLMHSIPLFLFKLISKNKSGLLSVLTLAALFTLYEYTRGLGFLRFPYGILAYSQYTFLPLIQIADVTGFLGISFLLYFINASLANLLANLEDFTKKFKEKDLFYKIRLFLFNRLSMIFLILFCLIWYGNIKLADNSNVLVSEAGNTLLSLDEIHEIFAQQENPEQDSAVPHPNTGANEPLNNQSNLPKDAGPSTPPSANKNSLALANETKLPSVQEVLKPAASAQEAEAETAFPDEFNSYSDSNFVLISEKTSPQSKEKKPTALQKTIAKVKQKLFGEQEIYYPPIKTMLVQPWFDYNLPWTPRNILSLEKKLTGLTSTELERLKAEDSYVDMIIWPESSIVDYYNHALPRAKKNKLLQATSISWRYRNYFQKQQIDRKLNFLVGTLALEEDQLLLPEAPSMKNQGPKNPRSAKDAKTRITQNVSAQKAKYNAIMLLDQQGDVADWSGKRYLVGFAEYFPFTKILTRFPWIKKILDDAQASSFTPFEEEKVFLVNGIPFSTLICYEDCFADLARIFTLKGASFLVLITNDAWSYSERSQIIHFSFSIFRAIENRRPIVRVGNAGLSALIDDRGRTHAALPMFEEAVTSADIIPRLDLSLYTKLGDWILLPLIIFIILVAVPVKFFSPLYVLLAFLFKKFKLLAAPKKLFTNSNVSLSPALPSIEEPKAPSTLSEGQKAPSTLSEEPKAPSNPSNPSEELKAPSNPSEELKAPSNPSEGQKPPSTLSEEPKAPSNPSEGQKAPSNPSEGQKAPSNPSEELKARAEEDESKEEF